MSKDLQVVDVHRQINNKINRMEKQLVPGIYDNTENKTTCCKQN